MSEQIVYWRGWTENQLAAYQQDQGSTNHCAKFAAASALNLLYGASLEGNSLVEWLSGRLFRGTLRYTIFGNNNGSFVFQTANLVRRLGQQNGLFPIVRSNIGMAETLKDIIKDGSSLAIVSVTYLQNQEPVIAYGKRTTTSLENTRWAGGHVMILGAYDSGHRNDMGILTPWGFLSSWPGRDHLYWMTDEDFQGSWGRLSLYNMVAIKLV